jgi:serine O-acetyltransferase
MKKQQLTRSHFALSLSQVQKSSTSIRIERTRCQRLLIDCLGTLFPHHRTSSKTLSSKEILKRLSLLEKELRITLTPVKSLLKQSPAIIASLFIDSLAEIYQTLINDAEAIYKGDPAAHSIDEVIIAYPGFFAIAAYRIAHTLHGFAIPIIPRVLSEYAHEHTGIDIHPAATIGKSFFIDHGTGIVIGETTVIKDNVKIYQGVTLGALSVAKSKANTKRHPTIESDVVIYSNATILGGETIVGKGSIIGGNVWLTKSVSAGSTVYHESVATIKARKING